MPSVVMAPNDDVASWFISEKKNQIMFYKCPNYVLQMSEFQFSV